jgi:glycosyltransferase involved in cell wall biosynthesis
MDCYAVAGQNVQVKYLKVRGPFHGPSGYDHHVRQFVRELDREGIGVELIDLPEWSPVTLPNEKRDPWFDSLHRPLDASVLLHFCMPHQVRPQNGVLNINYTMFEASRIPQRWVCVGLQHDAIILPSESSHRAWVESGFPHDRIRLCPLGVDADLYAMSHALLHLELSDGSRVADYKTRFLNISEMRPRKNLLGLLRTWLLATSRGDDAVLVLKLSSYAPGQREHFIVQLHLLERELGKRLHEAAPVHFIYDLFTDEDMARLYAAATHYISLSFGEGWDQPMVEAGAAGLALIAPHHSAYPTYLDDTVADLIPTHEIPVVYIGDRETGALFEGATWWEPDQDGAAAIIRSAITGGHGKKSARDRILKEFTWQKSTRRLIEILEQANSEIGKR